MTCVVSLYINGLFNIRTYNLPKSMQKLRNSPATLIHELENERLTRYIFTLTGGNDYGQQQGDMTDSGKGMRHYNVFQRLWPWFTLTAIK